MIAVGLDPGVATGLAVWDVGLWGFHVVNTVKIHRAFDIVLSWRDREPLGQFLVMFEDARRRGNSGAKSAAMAQGAGSVKRDSCAWQDFLEDHGIPHAYAPPGKGLTKWPAEYFARTTGWKGVTSEHARDAACRVWQLNRPQIVAMIREWEQRMSMAAQPKPRKPRKRKARA